MTLSGLESSLRGEVGRGGTLDNKLREWINEAQRVICHEAAFAFLRTSTSLATVASTRSVALPSGCGDILRLEYDDGPVIGATREHIMRMYGSTDDGTPKHYERVDGGESVDTLEIWPLPDDAYTITLTYLAIFTDLATPTESNALTITWPKLVVYQAKILAAQYIPDPELEQVAQRQYLMRLRTVNKAELRRDNEPLNEMAWSPHGRPNKSWRE